MVEKPCCLLLHKLSQTLESLTDPNVVREAMETFSHHCVLMKLFGRSKVKWDLAKSECCLAVSPDEMQTVIDELSKTGALHPALGTYDGLLAFMNGILANNAVLKQIDDKTQIFLSELREGEKRFGRVPETSLLKENLPENTFSMEDRLKAHPLITKSTQFDGIPPKSNPDPKQDPEAARNAEELQNRLVNRPSPSPSPTPTPTTPTLRRG